MDDFRGAFESAEPYEPGTTTLRVDTAEAFLALDLPERELILSPWLPTQGLTMVVAKRGVGKTHLALGTAYAVATGGHFLKWHAPTPRRVLYVDGEMPAKVIQDRLAEIVRANDAMPPEPDYLRIVTPDRQELGMPDLSTTVGQDAIMALLGNTELVILDNLACLCRTGRENEAESWTPVQTWLLELRRKGVAVLLVHHAGKGGAQRGTSAREDVLDSVLNLSHPPDYLPQEGARFEVSYEKARGFTGDDARSFEAKLEVRDNGALWSTKDLEESRTEKIAELLNEGMSQKDIADFLDIDKGTVSRHAKKARAAGLVQGDF